MTSKQVPLVIALGWIVASMFFTGVVGYKIKERSHLKEKERQTITKILQRGSQKEALSSRYLAEVLSLSIDRPSLAKNFDLTLAAKKLCSSPVIEKAKVFLQQTDTLVVDYETRRPAALLYDYTNIALDAAGVPFPLFPFYSPKNLTEIFLGEGVVLQWNKAIAHPKLELALKLYKILSLAPFALKRIDVSEAFADTLGKRQIVLILEESFKMPWQTQEITCILPRILRLNTKDYLQELGNYLVLRDDETLAFDPETAKFDAGAKVALLPKQVIDFRVANMAFIKTN
jgi:hypothetical protein